MRYIVDVTQLAHWSGNLTGIPRVMDELALRFSKYKQSETTFVCWVKDIDAMCEIDFTLTRSNRGHGIDFIRKNDDSLAAGATSKVTITIKRIVKRVGRKTRLDKTALFQRIANAGRAAEFQNYKRYEPVRHDKLFIPWGEWWDQRWLDKVVSYAESGVDLYPVCHDIRPMVVPQFSGSSGSLADFVSQVFPVSRKIITESQSTKADLTKWMKSHRLKAPSIELFRIGEDFSTTASRLDGKDMHNKFGVRPDEYLIYVSTIEPRKNHTLLYYTYKLAHSRGVQLPKLLIIGRVGHDTSEIIKFIKLDPEVNNLIRICDFVGDDELGWLYDNCMFSVVPSFYEGWGMSVVESIARGKSVVSSNSSSLAEMPKNCVIYFNPNSTDECLNAIMEMMQPDTLRKYRKNAHNYVTHTWDASFQQILKILG